MKRVACAAAIAAIVASGGVGGAPTNLDGRCPRLDFHLRVLELAPTTLARLSQKVVDRQFRRLARRCHPDVRPGDAAARERFEELNRSRASLRDCLSSRPRTEQRSNQQQQQTRPQPPPRRKSAPARESRAFVAALVGAVATIGVVWARCGRPRWGVAASATTRRRARKARTRGAATDTSRRQRRRQAKAAPARRVAKKKSPTSRGARTGRAGSS